MHFTTIGEKSHRVANSAAMRLIATNFSLTALSPKQ